MGNIWSANTILGTAIDEQIQDKKSKAAYLHHATETSKEIRKKFPKRNIVGNTFRFDSNADETLCNTNLYPNEHSFQSKEFTCEGVVDRSGSGDYFMAGLIMGYIIKLNQKM
jgi:2-dehydro-3-deoxygluconokinase